MPLGFCVFFMVFASFVCSSETADDELRDEGGR